MESKKPANEGEAWAQIGTKIPKNEPDKTNSKLENSTTNEEEELKLDTDETNDRDTEGNGLEIDMDAPMDPIQIEAPESDNTTTDKSMSLEEQRKKNSIGDGFDDSEIKEKDKEDERKRDRSRSRERERSRLLDVRDGRPESTNSSNPKKIRSRVFVGQLNMDKCTMEGLHDAFEKYGAIQGINLQSGYAFVQFDSEESALLAIKGMNKAELYGQEIVVSKPNAWVNLDKEEARMESRSHRALVEELEYLRRKDAERSRYERRDYDRYRGYDRGGYERGYDRGYEREYDRYERDRYPPPRELEREDRYHYGGHPPPPMPPPRGSSSYYGEERYRESQYYGGGSRGAPGSGSYYMGGAGGGGGESYYGGRRM